jgi:hypothetical protein
MKKTLLMTIFVFGVCSSIQAGTCPLSATLATYDGAGFTCNIGGLDFSGFQYTPTGHNAPLDSAVTVKTQTGTESGLIFDAGWAAGSGNEQDSLIQYTVTCDGCSITDMILKMGGDFAAGNSFINVAETEDNGLVPGLGIEDVGMGKVINSAMETFGPESTLQLSKDIHIDGGNSGDSAGVSTVSNLFSTNTQTAMSPEPSLLLLCVGGLSLLPVARKMRRA